VSDPPDQAHRPTVAAGPRRTDVPVLAFDQVTFGYGRIAVLREVSLQIAPAEFVAIIGANGSGKTTLMKLALGLLRPTHGTVRLFDEPVARFGTWQRIGYVPQRAAADASVPISVDEVVRSGLAGHLGPLRRPSREQRRQVEHVVDLMGLSSIRKQAVATLSGGQQQRTLIARALVTDPDLLVLDEPSAGGRAARPPAGGGAGGRPPRPPPPPRPGPAPPPARPAGPAIA
jgi:zinc transport system ATP-binding protein